MTRRSPFRDRRRLAGSGRCALLFPFAQALALALLLTSSWAAEPVAPEAPSDAELITRRRAAEAVKAYAEATAPAAPLDAELAERIAEIEMLVTEGESFFAAGRVLKAGDCVLAASAKLAKVTAAERATLGARLKLAQDKAIALHRRLAEPSGLAVPPPLPAE